MVKRHAKAYRITQWQSRDQRGRWGDPLSVAVRLTSRAQHGFVSSLGSSEHQSGLVHGVPCTSSYLLGWYIMIRGFNK